MNVLLLTDFSDNSIDASKYAMELLVTQPCTFHLLNIQIPSEYLSSDILTSVGGTSIYESVSRDNLNRLELLKKELIIHSSKETEIDVHFDFDTFTDGIAQTVQLQHIDLIVVGKTGETGLSKKIFGGHVISLIKTKTKPLMVVPPNYKFSKIRNVLFTISEGDEISLDSILFIASILKSEKVTIHLLYLNCKENAKLHSQFIENFDQNLVDLKIQHINNIPEASAIDCFEQLIPCQLHIMATHDESFLNRFFKGSSTNEISHKTTIPLLIL